MSVLMKAVMFSVGMVLGSLFLEAFQNEPHWGEAIGSALYAVPLILIFAACIDWSKK